MALDIEFKSLGEKFENLKQMVEQRFFNENENKEYVLDLVGKTNAPQPEDKNMADLLGYYYFINNQTGKALKIYNKLVEEYPEDEGILGNAAISNARRGFKKKAKPLFEKAYELGNRNCHFIINYASFCQEEGNSDKSYTILLDAIEKTSSPDMFACLLVNLFAVHMNEEDIYAQIERVTQINPLIAIESSNAYNFILSCLIMDLISQKTVYDDLQKLVALIEKLDLNKKEIESNLTFAKLALEDHEISKDSTLDSHIKVMTNANTIMELCNKYGLKVPEEEVAVFFKTLQYAQNSIMAKKENLADQITYLRLKYPATAAAFKKFFDDSETSNGSKKVRKINIKTGRNEPCPCGSKKKYKNVAVEAKKQAMPNVINLRDRNTCFVAIS